LIGPIRADRPGRLCAWSEPVARGTPAWRLWQAAILRIAVRFGRSKLPDQSLRSQPSRRVSACRASLRWGTRANMDASQTSPEPFVLTPESLAARVAESTSASCFRAPDQLLFEGKMRAGLRPQPIRGSLRRNRIDPMRQPL